MRVVQTVENINRLQAEMVLDNEDNFYLLSHIEDSSTQDLDIITDIVD